MFVGLLLFYNVDDFGEGMRLCLLLFAVCCLLLAAAWPRYRQYMVGDGIKIPVTPCLLAALIRRWILGSRLRP
jgi:hypothetical protein